MESRDEAWQARLPTELRTWVIRPQHLECFHEDSVPASKWRGYDARGDLCYYRHTHSLWEDVYDDEEPYRRSILRESFEAWRSLDGRWFRRIQRTEGPDQCRSALHDSGFEVVAPVAVPRR